MTERIYKHKLVPRKSDGSTVTTEFLEFLYAKRHPARAMDFDTLLGGLNEAVKQKTITAKKDPSGQLTIYNYGVTTTWGIFECIARGLVLDVANRKVIATPFPKFFNYGEIAKTLPSGSFEATEKMDGSLGIAFCVNNEWYVATRGSFQSVQAVWATSWFRSHVAPKLSKKYSQCTLLFEIIYPENRIVITYDYSALVLLGAYHGNGFEFNRCELETFSSQADVRLTQLYDFQSITNILDSATSLPGDKEGWVIRFGNGNCYRMKIKGNEYCSLHRCLSMCTPLNVWTKMKKNEDLKEFEDSLPEEFAMDCRKIINVLSGLLEERLESIKIAIDVFHHLSVKDLGMLLSTVSKRKEVYMIDVQQMDGNKTSVPGWTLPFVFLAKKDRNFQKCEIVEMIRDPKNDKKAARLRDKLFDSFRPLNNTLEGYSPSGVTNRFSEE